MSDQLRDQVTKLANEHPEFRRVLVPVLKEAISRPDAQLGLAEEVAGEIRRLPGVADVSRNLKLSGGVVNIMYSLEHGFGSGWVQVVDDGIIHLPSMEMALDGKWAVEGREKFRGQVQQIAKNHGSHKVSPYRGPRGMTGWKYMVGFDE